MGFLIKSAFWLSIVLLLIPFGTNSNDEPTIGAVEAFLAARALVDDMSGLCERRPDVCEVGRAAMQTIGIRARETARIAYTTLDEHFGKDAQEAEIVTGSVPAQPQLEEAEAAE